MSRFWSDHVAGLSPYIPGEQPTVTNLLKLNTNENPYGPSPRAIEAIKAAAGDGLRLYPDSDSAALRQAIADLNAINSDQVFLGNGSDEILAHVFNGLFRRAGRPVLMPDITYSFYQVYCRLYDIPVKLVPLADDFSIRVSDYTCAHTVPPAAIIFANPNAPTGCVLPLSDIEQILKANPDVVVVVDEAYVDFGAQSSVSLLVQYENLIIIRTLSKSHSFAGLRVGFAMASKTMVQGLVRIKDSFNSYPLDKLAQAGALAAIQDTAYLDQTRHAIMVARGKLTAGLLALGFEVLPSMANFVFVRHAQHSAVSLSSQLRHRNILVRHFAHERVNEFLRVTVGTESDCDRLCTVLAELLGHPDKKGD